MKFSNQLPPCKLPRICGIISSNWSLNEEGKNACTSDSETSAKRQAPAESLVVHKAQSVSPTFTLGAIQ